MYKNGKQFTHLLAFDDDENYCHYSDDNTPNFFSDDNEEDELLFTKI